MGSRKRAVRLIELQLRDHRHTTPPVPRLQCWHRCFLSQLNKKSSAPVVRSTAASLCLLWCGRSTHCLQWQRSAFQSSDAVAFASGSRRRGSCVWGKFLCSTIQKDLLEFNEFSSAGVDRNPSWILELEAVLPCLAELSQCKIQASMFLCCSASCCDQLFLLLFFYCCLA